MNKSLTLALIIAVGSVGCGKKETVVIAGPDGSKVSTNQDGTSMTVTDKDGTTATFDTDGKGGLTMSDGKGGNVQMGVDTVGEGDLGLPYYPGSVEPAGSMSGIIENDKEKVVTSIRNSKDAPAKVVDFYNDKVKNSVKSAATAGTMQTASLTGQLESGAEATIAVTKDGDQETHIMVTVKHKK